MAWRYINPGYSKLINYRGSTSKLTDIADTSKSKTRLAYQNTSDLNYCTFAVLPQNGEYWVKADFYYTATATYDYLMIYFRDSAGTGVLLRDTSRKNPSACYYAGNSVYDLASVNLKQDSINTVWVHVKWGEAGTGFLEFRINDTTFEKLQEKSFPAPTSTMKYLIYTNSYGTAYFSNIIISDEEINIKEQVVALPVSTTETTMTLQSDTYLADSVGQTLLQSVNVSSLINNFGSDSKVTGIALVGNPAYRTGEQLSSLTAISKTGGTVTEYGTSNLDTASDTVIWQGVPVASDTTIADLQNIQLGWKAGD